mgnify:CR=1 FL=1
MLFRSGKIPVAGPALRFSDMPPHDTQRIPLAGEHSDAVLMDWLGYDANQRSEERRVGKGCGHGGSQEQSPSEETVAHGVQS